MKRLNSAMKRLKFGIWNLKFRCFVTTMLPAAFALLAVVVLATDAFARVGGGLLGRPAAQFASDLVIENGVDP